MVPIPGRGRPATARRPLVARPVDERRRRDIREWSARLARRASRGTGRLCLLPRRVRIMRHYASLFRCWAKRSRPAHSDTNTIASVAPPSNAAKVKPAFRAPGSAPAGAAEATSVLIWAALEPA